jgi:transposase
MRFVAVKTVAQQDRQALHRVRERLVGHRTALVNQTRGLLAEYGIVLAQQVAVLRRRLPEVLEDGENELTCDARRLFADLYQELLEIDQRITREASDDEVCQRLQAVDGVGPMIASAATASVGDARVFRNGRQFAASLGLVPRQYSTGGKTRLGGISKRGDKYLRKLLIQGATIDVYHAAHKVTPRARWIRGLVKRCGKQKASVAVANKNARIIWALMARGEHYRASAH